MPDDQTTTPPSSAPSGEVLFKKIAIVGTAPSSRQSAPFPSPGCPFGIKEWNVRCIGMDPAQITMGWHRWYEIHDIDYLLSKQNPDYLPQNDQHVRWLAEVSSKGADIRLMSPSPLIPNARLINRQGIKNAWDGPFAREFRNSSIAWMMAEAILEFDPLAVESGEAEIGLWGVDMALASEYQSQRSGVFFFLDECFKRRIKISLPPESDIFFGTGEYPDCGENPISRKLSARRKEIMFQLGQAQQIKMQAMIKEATTAGALEAHDWFSRTFISKG